MNATVANVIRLFKPQSDEAASATASVVTVNPERRRQELGPRQLAWCKRKIPHFRESKRDADRVAAEQAASRAVAMAGER